MGESMVDSKLLRKNTLAKRDSLEKGVLQSKSALIETRVFDIQKFQKAESVFVYVNFRSEVITRGIIERLLQNNKRVTVPITHVSEKRIDAIEITDPKKELVPGYCNILEPKKDIWVSQKVAAKDIDIILLPGSVFDITGGRFGYGGGFYDRFLSSNPKAVRIGLAFELQVVDKVPLQDHDELLDYVITENRCIEGSRDRTLY
jgi:5-formyltetrahydrofolate cyclo-ligase